MTVSEQRGGAIMYPSVDQELDRQAAIEARHARAVSSADVAIREAEPTDLRALERLAELDSGHMPTGLMLVAKADGQIRAAMSVDTGAVVADPFASTGQLVALLRLRADQLRRDSRRERRRRGLLGGFRLRLGGAIS
jgi:hypothetical protein